MNKPNLMILILAILVVSFIASINSQSTQIVAEVYEGKNNVTFNQTLYVTVLVKFNPHIEAVSYTDLYGRTIGFVNVFGGIGENFLITPYDKYEIISSKNTTIVVPS
jgi:hypothetical protein